MLDAAPDAAAAPIAISVDPATLAAPSVLVTACPELPNDLSWWAEEIVPTCAPQPFGEGINLCGGPCPRPCQVVVTEASVVTTISTVAYDTNGRWLSTSPLPVSDDASDACTYNDAGRSSCTRTFKTRTKSMTKTIERTNGRITKIIDADRGPVTLRYDATGHARHVTRYGEMSKLTYDHVGRLVHDDLSSYKYNRAGQLTERNAGANGFSRYTWSNNRLVRIVERAAGMGGDFTTSTITYDASGRPLSIARDGDDLGDPHVTTFVYDCAIRTTP